MRRTWLAAAVVVALVAPTLGAQQPPPRNGPGPAAVRIDPLTASIQGRITAADTGAPIPRAEVRAMGTGGINRLATTDADGRYVLRDLPAAEFRVSVTKSGFVPLDFGQRRPFEAATPIRLREGQQFSANLVLPRGGAIAGRVYDEAGEPVAEVRVQALRPRTTDGRRRLVPAGMSDTSDDTGAFRLYGLPPGDYFVAASRAAGSSARPAGGMQPTHTHDASRTPILTFYPGTPSLDEAQRITLDIGADAHADIQIGTTSGATVSGIVLDSSGSPAADATVTLMSEWVSVGPTLGEVAAPPLALSVHTGADGAFALTGVPPGPYTLQAIAFSTGLPPHQVRTPLSVNADVAGLTLSLNAGGSLEGEVVRDAGVSRPLPTGLRFTVRAGGMFSGGVMTFTSTEGRFRILGLAEPAPLDVENLPPDWMVKAVMLDGRDVTDEPIDLRNGRSASVRVIVTDRITDVSGTITGLPEPDDAAPVTFSVVVFPQDAVKWSYSSRFIRTVRSDADGRFSLAGLPPSDRYLAVAVDYLEAGEGSDPEFLERIRTSATPFSLAEAERKTIQLRLIRR